MSKPFYVLGVTHPISWNNAACLLKDGRLVAMAEEERFNRFKHSPRVPPLRAIDYCLGEAGIGLDDVGAIGVGWDQGATWLPSFDLKRYNVGKHYLNQLPFKVDGKRARLVNHHVAHALSAFFSSGFPEANLISLDASGGYDSGLLGVGRGRAIEEFHRISNDSSWGVLYGYFTRQLGFRPHSDEGKVMGLAAFGTPQGAFPFIDFGQDVPLIDREGLKKHLSKIPLRDWKAPLDQGHKDLAATLQWNFEKAILQMAAWLHKKTGLKSVCMGGGCALNCSTNGKVLLEPFVDKIFVQPAAHDASTALGAAFHVHAEVTRERPDFVMDHAYWGPAFTNAQVKTALDKGLVPNVRKSQDIAKDVADLLADGKVVGWFQGRMEIGPRALGGRSILADPRTIAMKDRVNNRVKNREPWRPFAPSFLAEAFAPYVRKPHPSPFMILAFQGQDGWIGKLPAAAHVDKTIRVQTVEKAAHPRYWALIDAFNRKTGVPCLLNTSFNVAGQPIVCTPFDAISTFFACGLDVLAIEDYLVVKG